MPSEGLVALLDHVADHRRRHLLIDGESREVQGAADREVALADDRGLRGGRVVDPDIAIGLARQGE